MNQSDHNCQEQEIPSVYFNNIIHRDVRPITVEELDAVTIDEFNRQVKLATDNEADLAVKRVRYLIPYILQNIDWETYAVPLQAWQLRYYYQRERFIEKTGLDWDKFLDHEPMQNSIKALGLDAEPVFEFILFLKYYYGLRSDLRFSCLEQFNTLVDELDKNTDKTVSLDVNVGGKHFKINNPDFIRAMFHAVDKSKISSDAFVNDFDQGSARDKIRALDYYIVKTLLDYMPTDKSLRRGGRYSQAERNFGLSVLSLCGRLPDIDREGECSQENNATFDKLMRDFSGVPIPFAMELFL
ncbi:MAG: hypothetical protein K2K26_01550 [Muribaculaceae bacterium]|nr:hypothetical protein [Muribaculaceae bacterium]